MEDNKYCYPNTNVLKNKLDIRDNVKLAEAERKITFPRANEIRANPVKGEFDYNHLKSIHKALFSDVYDWAGKERTVDIAKGNNLFSRAVFIRDNAEKVFNNISRDNYLIGMPKDKVAERLAYHMGEINALHPFREGNGRSQRQFIGYLAKAAGFELQWNKANPDNMLKASIQSMFGDSTKLEVILKEIAEPITLSEQRDFLKTISKSALKAFDNCGILQDRTKEIIETNEAKEPKEEEIKDKFPERIRTKENKKKQLI